MDCSTEDMRSAYQSGPATSFPSRGTSSRWGVETRGRRRIEAGLGRVAEGRTAEQGREDGGEVAPSTATTSGAGAAATDASSVHADAFAGTLLAKGASADPGVAGGEHASSFGAGCEDASGDGAASIPAASLGEGIC